MRSLSLSFIIGLYVRVLNALDLVHLIMGHHKLVQPKMGRGSWGGGRARARGAAAPLPPPGAVHAVHAWRYLIVVFRCAAGGETACPSSL